MDYSRDHDDILKPDCCPSVSVIFLSKRRIIKTFDPNHRDIFIVDLVATVWIYNVP